MQTLLPKNELHHIRHEYRLRCLILLLFFFSGAVWIGIISLFPAYLISVTEEHNAEAQAGAIDHTRQSSGAQQTSAQVKDANALIKTVTASEDTIFFSSLVEDIDSRRVPGMIITDFNLAHAANTKSQSVITIGGNAATRNILVAFEQNLESDPRLSVVELPVSDLAQQTDINFTISMRGIE